MSDTKENRTKFMNAFSVDVEDYWSIFSRDWLNMQAGPTEAVFKNTTQLLEILERNNIKGSFFILGEVAENYPALVKKIHQAGHEIGSHGMQHRQIFKSTPHEFREEVKRCKNYLEDLTGLQILGFRAPAFSINKTTIWALEVLAEAGFKYDSSISPIAGKKYGWPHFAKGIHRFQLNSGMNIIEVPMSKISFGFKELSVGGGYMRHFPYLYTKLAIKYIQRKRPVIIYVHPYEIDTYQPAVFIERIANNADLDAKKFHQSQMRNRETVKAKIDKLTKDFDFAPICRVIEKTLKSD